MSGRAGSKGKDRQDEVGQKWRQRSKLEGVTIGRERKGGGGGVVFLVLLVVVAVVMVGELVSA